MRRIFFITFLLTLFLEANQVIDNSFITRYEYGQMLYENPRGIGCNKCHGQKGEGALIAKYKDEQGSEHTVKGPDINKVSWKKFNEILSIKENKSLIMPTYFLTSEELVSIHYYITNLKKE